MPKATVWGGLIVLGLASACVRLVPMDDPRPEGSVERSIEVPEGQAQVFHLSGHFQGDYSIVCGGDLLVQSATRSATKIVGEIQVGEIQKGVLEQGRLGAVVVTPQPISAAKITRGTLKAGNLTSGNVRGGTIEGAHLEEVEVEDADLSAVTSAMMNGTEITGATLKATRIVNATLTLPPSAGWTACGGDNRSITVDSRFLVMPSGKGGWLRLGQSKSSDGYWVKPRN